jgi:RNA polymerase sigma factor (TIGR02999 family)
MPDTPQGDTGRATKDEVCELLRAWSSGDTSALEKLTPIVYDELHRLARRYMKGERTGHSLQTTALVNEAYMRLVDYTRMQWQDRAHFLAVSAQVMRRILIEHARRHNQKRGGGVAHVSLEEAALVRGDRLGDLVALDDALNALAELDARKAQVVEMRFFGGLNVQGVRRRAQGLGCHGDAGLEHREGVALSRAVGWNGDASGALETGR